MPTTKLYALTAAVDGGVGLLRPVAVLAVNGNDHAVSWMPGITSGGNDGGWVARLEALTGNGTNDTVTYWLDSANGLSWGIDRLRATDSAAAPAAAAGAALDELMAIPVI